MAPLPDLDQATPFGLSVVRRDGRSLLVFGSAVDNVGPGDLVVEGRRRGAGMRTWQVDREPPPAAARAARLRPGRDAPALALPGLRAVRAALGDRPAGRARSQVGLLPARRVRDTAARPATALHGRMPARPARRDDDPRGHLPGLRRRLRAGEGGPVDRRHRPSALGDTSSSTARTRTACCASAATRTTKPRCCCACGPVASPSSAAARSPRPVEPDPRPGVSPETKEERCAGSELS